MVDGSENSNVQHQESTGSSEQTPLTTENLATHNSDTDDSHDSGSSNDHQNSDQNQADPTLDYIGSQFGNENTTTTEEGNPQHDDTPMERWKSSSEDRPAFWSPDEEQDENEQGGATN